MNSFLELLFHLNVNQLSNAICPVLNATMMELALYVMMMILYSMKTKLHVLNHPLNAILVATANLLKLNVLNAIFAPPANNLE